MYSENTIWIHFFDIPFVFIFIKELSEYFNILISIAEKPIIENSIRISLKETKTLLDQQCLCYEHRGEEAPQGSGFPSVTYRTIPQ